MLKAISTVTEAKGTCGETLQGIYGKDRLDIPEGYAPTGFVSPRAGEAYIDSDGLVATAISNHQFSPKVIVRAL